MVSDDVICDVGVVNGGEGGEVVRFRNRFCIMLSKIFGFRIEEVGGKDTFGIFYVGADSEVTVVSPSSFRSVLSS